MAGELENRWKQLGRAIEQNSEVLDHLYHSIEESIFLENPPSRFSFLVEHGLVMGNSGQGYTPTLLLLQLGEVLAQARNRQVLAPDIDEWLHDLRRLVNRYHEASGDQSGVRREIYTSVLSLMYALRGEVETLEHFIDSKFGFAASIKAKQAENEHVLARTSRYINKLTAIGVQELSALAHEDHDLLVLFLRRLMPEVNQCRSRMMAALPRLEQMLWSYRKHNRITRMVRASAAHLSRVGVLGTRDVPDDVLAGSVFTLVATLPLSGAADIPGATTLQQEQSLIGIVKKMSARKAFEAIPETEVPSGEINLEAPDVEEVPVPRLTAHVKALCKAALHGPVSVRAFWESDGDGCVPPGVWLWWAHQELMRLAPGNDQVQVILEEEIVKGPAFSANESIEDVTVHLQRRSHAG